MPALLLEAAPPARGRPQESTPLTRRQVFELLGYAFLLLLLFNVATTGVAGVAAQFILKDTLRLGPQRQATFGFLADIPSFIAFAFGFLRDRWRPFRWGDRGYFLLLPPLLCGSNLLLAFGPFSYARLLTAFVLAAALATWLGAAVQGLMTVIAQHRGMAGRFSVLVLMTPSLVGMLASFIGGHLAAPGRQHLAFLISAGLCLPLMALAFWKPQGTLPDRDATTARMVPEGAAQAVKRLAGHRAVYLPALILFLWCFAPGWGTPLFYYMTNTIRLSAGTYGDCGSVMGGGTLLALLAYTGLCARFRLRPLLWWGTLLGLLGCPLFLLIHSPAQAYPVYFLAGASLGIGLCAFNDLLIRCCPQELEGAALMVTAAASSIAGDTSDIFGSWLYDRGGFVLALAVSTAFTGLIFVVLPLIPKRLTTPREGEPLAAKGREVKEMKGFSAGED